jgi:hypothetical protein
MHPDIFFSSTLRVLPKYQKPIWLELRNLADCNRLYMGCSAFLLRKNPS